MKDASYHSSPSRPAADGGEIMKCCGTCKWIQPILKGSENEYWQCGFPAVPRPYFEMMMLQFGRNPHYRHLSVGDPQSDYGATCQTYEAKP